VAAIALLAWGGLSSADEGSALGGEFGVLGGIVLSDEDLTGETGQLDPTLGLRGGSVFSSRFIWYVDALFSSVDSGSSLGDARLYTGRTGVEWLFIKNRRSSWFVTGGFGWVQVDYNSGDIEDFHRPLVSAGVGQRFAIGGGRQLRWEVRGDVTVDNRPGLSGEGMNQGLALVGLIWGPTGSALSGGDSDQDGVSDAKDRCPETPSFALVDRHGCPQDSDGDRVFDGVDQCPGTAYGQQVNPLGCLSDSDEDGVYDTTDACPGTVAGVTVDDWGCPRDRDRDGVPTGLDRCPRTFAGVIVDEFGCALDSDGDGVPDGLDRCPDTPGDVRIDGKGCVASNFLYVPETRTLTLWLDFEINADELSDEGILVLTDVLPVLAASEYRFEIGGHLDATSGESDPERLSFKRAEAVRDFLLEQGIEADRLETRGYGTSQPLESDLKATRSIHSRIEIKRID
jgi:outer membrane protein OmpA-like peptidoglycan-associated protein